MNNIFHLSMEIKFCRICSHDADWVERKTKVDYTLWNILSGSLSLEINQHTLHAGVGDVLLFHPGDSYKAWCDADHCTFLVTFFNIQVGNTLNPLTASDTAGLYTAEAVRLASFAFCRKFQQLSDTAFSRQDFRLYASFLSFFSELAPYFGSQMPFHTLQEPLAVPKLTELTTLLEEHPERSFTVKEMATFLGMSEKYFSGFFHLRIGMTPKQYLTKCRMKYALTLLSNPALSLQEIASKTHYADQYSFAKAFKSYYGEAPGSFRRHYNQRIPNVLDFII